MPSRVIHIRLDDWVLLGCHDILKTGGKEVVNLPLSTVVRIALEALVRKMQQNEHIPQYNPDDIVNRLRELQIAMADPDIPFSPEELFETIPEVDNEMLLLAEEAARQIEIEGEPKNIQQQVTISKTDFVEVVKTVDILKIESKDFEYFFQRAPKDRFIEWANSLSDIAIKKAVAICYTNLNEDQWGSSEAEKIITDLYKMHDGTGVQDGDVT